MNTRHSSFLFFLVVTLFCLSYSTFPQVHFVPNADTCSRFNTVLTHQYPPLASDMSFENIISWIILDSLCRHADYGQFINWASRTTQDTLRQAMKYFYRLQDFDPLLLDQYSMDVHDAHIPPASLYSGLRQIYENRFGEISLGLKSLLRADYIIHGRVVNQSSWVMPGERRFCTEIFCADIEIIDKIKGQKLYPTCSSLPEPNRQYSAREEDRCIRVVWTRACFQDLVSAQDTANYNYWGPSHMAVNEEFILILNHILMSRNGDSISWHIEPFILIQEKQEEYYTRLPIANGQVIDSNNFFGFGTGVPLTDFKSDIRTTINSFLGQ